MIYQELVPRKELQPYIKCLWVLDNPHSADSRIERIVPDGRMEMIFHFGGRVESQDHAVIAGQIRQPLLIRPQGPVSMIGVRFFPFGFSAIFKIPSQELTDNVFTLEEVAGKSGYALKEQVHNAKSNQEIINLIEDHLSERLNSRGDYDFRVHRITRKIYQRQGVFKSPELAEEFNIGARQMERLFQDRIGLSPNVLGRIIRFQRAIQMKLNSPTTSLTDLSHATGYYDQSHFIKDFKEFSGLSPKQYFQETHKMSDFFADSLSPQGDSK